MNIQTLAVIEFFSKLETICWLVAFFGFFAVIIAFALYKDMEMSRKGFVYTFFVFFASFSLGLTLNYFTNLSFAKLITNSFTEKECQLLKNKIIDELNPYAVEIYFSRCEQRR